MCKKVLLSSLVAASLLLSGCGEESTSCRIDIQNDLDTAQFDAAISSLNGECATAFTPSDRYFNLASAYMGKAGFGAIDVVTMLLDSDQDRGDAFSAFTRSVDASKKEDSLALLNIAQEYYLRSISPETNVSMLSADICKNSDSSDDSRVVNACFYIGFNQTIQATTTISYLTEDVDALVNAINDVNGTTTPLDMKASLDALAWATGSTTLPNDSAVTAKQVTIAGQNYTHLVVLQNGETFYRLADSSAPSATSSTLLTSGYCLADGNKTACEGLALADGSIDTAHPNFATCYACPLTVADTNSSQSVADLLVDTLNNGTDVLVNVTDDEDIQQSVDDFIKDITGDQNANVSNSDITVEDIIEYLNK